MITFFRKKIKKGDFIMGLLFIFAAVTILAGIGTYTSFKNKNWLGIVFAAGTFVIFGAFTVASFLTENSVPVAH